MKHQLTKILECQDIENAKALKGNIVASEGIIGNKKMVTQEEKFLSNLLVNIVRLKDLQREGKLRKILESIHSKLSRGQQRRGRLHFKLKNILERQWEHFWRRKKMLITSLIYLI